MAEARDQQLVDRFETFYRQYYADEIAALAREYPRERKSLVIDWADVFRFDPDFADDFVEYPDRFRDAAEEALRLYDLPVDVSLAKAHVRVQNLGELTEIRDIRADHINTLVSVRGIVRKATNVRPKIREATFVCQRCGAETVVPQTDAGFQDPYQCESCERQGPFQLEAEHSEFVDAQKLRVQESPEGLGGGETPQAVDMNVEDDLTGEVTPGDHVVATGILRLDQGKESSDSPIFDVYLEGVSLEIEDEEFEEMDITEADKREIIELSERDDLYEQIVASIAPAIYGYDQAKLAMALQLFSGVTKHLPDGSRIRGDLHMLLIGDPGTGKSQLLQYIRNIAPRSVYTSGKGSSSAGLCVTGDTMVHTGDGFRKIEDVAEEYHPSPVVDETAARGNEPIYTFDSGDDDVKLSETSHVWRMPEKECKRIETSHGKSLETSLSTPVLTWSAGGFEWREVSDVEAGDYVAVPRYPSIDRTSPSVRSFLELTNEKIKPSDESVAFLRSRLRETFGTLRDAAAELDFSEDFIYDSLSNRHLPLEKLDRILDAIDADRSDVEIDRVMTRHGHSIAIPDAFDEDFLYLLGLVCGDGDVMVSARGENRGRVRISNTDEALLERAIDSIERLFDKSVQIEYQEDRVPSIRLHSATVARLFRNLGVESPKDDLSLPPEITTAEHADAFLRGLFDADGSVSARDDGGSSIQFSTICGDLARQVQLMLETYGVRARLRERDRRGTNELENGYVIESKSVQHHLTMYGVQIDRFADAIGFESAEKQAALETVVEDARRRGDTLPVGETLLRADGVGGRFYQNMERGDNPSRERTAAIVSELDLGDTESLLRQAVEADLNWERVVTTEETGKKEVFDMTVPGTNNFLGNGIVTHNTAAAVRDDFGDGQQWTLEAGALVLADQGIAAVDELDKMRSEDRSAMHEALEQQSISISKAGINATLKARCSLLGAANPKYGRFDQYEPIGEQIDLEPALISRFDLIFTVTDQPDAERDAELADHILQTNYAGELNTHRNNVTTSNVSDEEVDGATDTVEPAIDADLLRKYVAYARRNTFPTMTPEARSTIEDFYVDLRSKGEGDDAPVPVTARKLEALVRLSEASARARLSDTVEQHDAERVIDIVRTSLQAVGVDPETDQYDADVIETGTSKSQRDRIKNIKQLIEEIEDDFEEGAPIDEVLVRAEEIGMERSKAEHEIDKLKQKGEVYEPRTDHLRTT